jgi:beta-lactamase regulating signal transducer with metallopeptidase domain
MNKQLLITLTELLVHFLLWSSALALITYVSIRVNNNFHHWSALWKTTLLLCFLPFFPWSYFEWISFDWSYSNRALFDLPKEWINGLTDVRAEKLDNFSTSGSENSSSQSLLILLLLVVTISTTRIISYLVKLKKFKRTLALFNRESINSPSLMFLTEEQRAFIDKRGVKVLLTHDKTSPYVTGLINPKLVLPESFFSLSAPQKILLIEHELTHIKHHDVAWLNMSQGLRCLLWFAPAIHFFHRQLEISIEIECDSRVLGVYPSMKREYAGALLNTIKLTQQKVQPQTAFFISQQFRMLKSRIILTQQQNKPQGINLMHKITLGLSAILLSTVSWALNANIENIMNVEEFLSIHKKATRHIDHNNKEVELNGTWISPVATAKVSSAFKIKRKSSNSKSHLGIDLVAKKGEQVVASSQGTVIIADDSTLHKNYGKVVVIDHGEATLSMYLHMDSIAVNKGDRVKQGQSIGKVGETGQATGPHLHFEILAAGRHVDPASIVKFE